MNERKEAQGTQGYCFNVFSVGMINNIILKSPAQHELVTHSLPGLLVILIAWIHIVGSVY